MLKQNQRLRLLQKISPQQIQFIKLLQIPTATLEQRIKEEIEKNPALEDEERVFNPDDSDGNYAGGSSSTDNSYSDLDGPEGGNDSHGGDESVAIEDYIANDSYDHRTRLPQSTDDEDDYETPIVAGVSLYDSLMDQLILLNLDDDEHELGEQIIGSVDENGYLQRPLKTIVQYMAFYRNKRVTEELVEQVLRKIQTLDPAGVGARSLQECLILQLQRKLFTEKHTKQEQGDIDLAIKVIDKHFTEFTKKHFHKIRSRMSLNEEVFSRVFHLITKLNPKPGFFSGGEKTEYIIPDFILSTDNAKVSVRLNSRNAPDLRLSNSYLRMYQQYKKLVKEKRGDKTTREAYDFVKQRLEQAQWFIDAIRQRQYTLLNTMEAIAAKQQEFFLSEGDEKQLRPMILKDIADEIDMDISTVSRVANSKYVQTDFGIYPLKFFFTEGIETEDGEIVSNREVKKTLEEIIGGESPKRPLSDDRLAEILKEKGYNIARRTVAKYREQLGIPVARLRKGV